MIGLIDGKYRQLVFAEYQEAQQSTLDIEHEPIYRVMEQVIGKSAPIGRADDTSDDMIYKLANSNT